MRIVRMRLKDFRGVAESEVRFDGSNITVVQGPNESGKSSIADALTILRGHKDSAASKTIRSLQPVGEDTGTEIEVEFFSGAYHFTYFKRFNKFRSTRLEIHAPRHEALTGDEAHERAESIFASTLDAQLWTAMHLAQGQSFLQPELASIEPLKAALEVTGSDPSTGSAPGLLDLIGAERARYFTAATGKPTGDYARLRTEVAELEAQRTGYQAELARATELIESHDRNLREAADLESALEEQSAKHADLKKTADDLVEVRREQERATLRLGEAAAQRDKAAAALASRTELLTDLDAAWKAVNEAQSAVGAGDDIDDAEARHTALAAERTTVRASLKAAERHRRGCEERLQLATLERDLDAVSRRVDRVVAARTTQHELLGYLGSHDIDDAVVHKISTARIALDSAIAARDAVAPTLAVTRLGKPVVTIDGAEVDDASATPVVGTTVAEVPGVIRVTVTSGASAQASSDAVRSAEDEFRGLLFEFGVTDLQAAQSEALERRDKESQLKKAEILLSQALADDSRDQLEQEHVSLATRAESLRDRLGDVELDTAACAAAIGEAEQSLSAAQDEAERVQNDFDTVRERLATVRQEALEAAHRASAASTSRDNLGAKLAAAREVVTDEVLHRDLATAESSVLERAQALSDVETALATADAEEIDASLGNARAAVDRLTADIAALASANQHLLGQLDNIGGEGFKDKLDEIVALHADKHRELLSMTARAEAAELLHRVMNEHHAAAQRRYVQPFKSEIEALGRNVFGADFEVTITADLTIESRHLHGKTITFDHLSAGAREQLAVLGRLACAKLVSSDDGAPLILDDAFGSADPDRLNDICDVLNRVGMTAQIIVLTCYPMRFAGIGDAVTVRLTP